jgi:hypothetical protein
MRTHLTQTGSNHHCNRHTENHRRFQVDSRYWMVRKRIYADCSMLLPHIWPCVSALLDKMDVHWLDSRLRSRICYLWCCTYVCSFHHWTSNCWHWISRHFFRRHDDGIATCSPSETAIVYFQLRNGFRYSFGAWSYCRRQLDRQSVS